MSSSCEPSNSDKTSTRKSPTASAKCPSCDLFLSSPPPAALYLFFVLTPYLFYETSGATYQRTRDLSALRNALLEQVRLPDSYADVQSVLGPGYRKSEDELKQYIQSRVDVGKDLEHFGGDFGNSASDFVVEYASNYRVKYTLIFREGFLVNYDAKKYQPPPENSSGTIVSLSD